MRMCITTHDLPHLENEVRKGARVRLQRRKSFHRRSVCLFIGTLLRGSAIVDRVRRFKVRNVVTEMIGQEGA